MNEYRYYFRIYVLGWISYICYIQGSSQKMLTISLIDFYGSSRRMYCFPHGAVVYRLISMVDGRMRVFLYLEWRHKLGLNWFHLFVYCFTTKICTRNGKFFQICDTKVVKQIEEQWKGYCLYNGKIISGNGTKGSRYLRKNKVKSIRVVEKSCSNWIVSKWWIGFTKPMSMLQNKHVS